MRNWPNLRAEKFRKVHPLRPDDHQGPGYGYFEIPTRELKRVDKLRVIFDDGRGEMETGWEHASVSLETRTPTWKEMCLVKDLFWSEDECVLQFHPPRSEHINMMEFCLHLFRPINHGIPLPPSILVGMKSLSV